LLTHMCLC